MDKRRNLKSLFLFLIPTNLILLLATVAFQLSGNPLYLAFAGAWFIIVSVTGFSQKMFKPIQAADLRQKSLGHLDSLVSMQVLMNDLDAADEVSKILLEQAEKLNDRE